MIKLLIADDHPGVRRGLMDLFSATPDIDVVAECSDGDEVVDAARHSRPDVALLDVVMSRVGGLQAAQGLLAEYPVTRVLLITGGGARNVLRDARALGASGLVLKGHLPGDLPDHVRTVAGGATTWPPAL